MMRKVLSLSESVLFGILAFVTLWYFYFSSTHSLRPFPYLFWPMMAFIAIFFAAVHQYKLERMDVLFFGSMIILSAGCFFSADLSESVISLLYYVIYYLAAKMIAENCSAKYIYGLILAFSVFHLICIFIQILAPDLYNSLLLPLLPSERHVEITEQMEYNEAYYGFSIQTSIVAMYLSIGAIFSVLKVNCSQSKRTKLIFIVLAALFMIGTFYTVRRGSTIAIIFLVVVIFIKSRINVLAKWLLLIVSVIALFWIGLENIPGLRGIISKFQETQAAGSMMNGRDVLFNRAFETFLDRPFFGFGLSQVGEAMGHNWLENSFLVILIECGMIGAIVYFIPHIFMFVKTASYQRQCKKEGIKLFGLQFSMYTQILFVLMSLIENYYATPLTLFILFLITFSGEKVFQSMRIDSSVSVKEMKIK